VASKDRLPGHYRRAHPRVRRPTTRVLAKPRLVRPQSRRAKILDVSPVRTEITPAQRPLAPPNRPVQHILTPDLADAEPPPSWWEPQADLEWRIRQWNAFDSYYRNRLLAQRAGAAFAIRVSEATDATILWSQYHALKALATRLDAGIATERERTAFGAGLREYDQNFERVCARRKALPG
jgi:hypothetical protein